MQASPPSHVQLRSVCKSYGSEARVLDGFSFEASQGDFVGIIGPSGCGKTTLLRLLAGLTPLSGGELTIDELHPADACHELSYVFQEPTLLPWLNVEDNIRLLLKLRNTDRDEATQRVAEVIRQVRLSGLEKRYPRQLSGGQKMRVSLARALSVNPRLLLLDEPFGALDEMAREHLNEELLAIRAEQPWTAFFVTHSVAEAVFLSNRILIMAAHPGCVHSVVEVDLPYPRTEETRSSPEYQNLVVKVSRLLRSVEAPKP